jgi:hypothetical protein
MARRKLTEGQVLAIRAACHQGATGKELREHYGVSAATISQIKHGVIYRGVKAPSAECGCTIEMATFREAGSKCLHCGGIVAKGGTL